MTKDEAERLVEAMHSTTARFWAAKHPTAEQSAAVDAAEAALVAAIAAPSATASEGEVWIGSVVNIAWGAKDFGERNATLFLHVSLPTPQSPFNIGDRVRVRVSRVREGE